MCVMSEVREVFLFPSLYTEMPGFHFGLGSLHRNIYKQHFCIYLFIYFCQLEHCLTELFEVMTLKQSISMKFKSLSEAPQSTSEMK